MPAYSFFQDSKLRAGPILPLLHSHHIRTRHSTPFLYPPPPEQRSALVLPVKMDPKASKR